ncbi:hypothetical protein QYZ87_08435 [Porphyromonadaceae bacterium W3.11]|nr:hypothetical protein [Porphyromonadaceae bacterium W3.11]MDN4754548.1 hypothetical protein [Porphyromonadaceae bacterium W3.11]
MMRAGKAVQDARMRFLDDLFSWDSATNMYRSLSNACLRLTINYLYYNESTGVIPTTKDIDELRLLYDLVDWLGNVAEAEGEELK